MRMDERRGSFAELETAQSLVAAIRAAQPAIDENRELPVELADELMRKGLFRLLLPKAFGGSELSLPAFIRCIEVIAEADGSTGWCVGQGGVFPNLADRMSPEAAQMIWGADPNAVVATGTPFGSTARPVSGGFRLTGRWRFASGCRHANWFGAMASTVDDAGEVTGFGMFLVPRSEIDLGDGWHVRGLRGTGSREYTLNDFEVASPSTMLGYVLRDHCGQATGLPAHLLFASAFASVGLGVARNAVDSLMAIIEGKTPAFSSRTLKDDDMVQVGLAEAEATWGASRAFLHEVAEASAYAYRQHGEVSGRLRTQLRLAATSAMRRSGEVVLKAYELAGSTAIFEDHPLQRSFQDIHALTQQVQGRPAHFRTVGRVLLGLEPDNAVL